MTAIAPDTEATTWLVGGALEIGFTTTFDWVYDDKGTGAAACGSFWQPNVSGMPGYWSLGSLGVNNGGNYNYNPSGDRAIVVVKDLTGTALAAPTGYTQIWADHGSGGNNDGSVWRPIAPDGYIAMGLVVVGGYNQPSLDAVRCVSQSLVHRATPGASVWCDAGSGAHGDFGSWEVLPPAAAPGTLSLAPGTFCGSGSYDENTVRAEPTTLYSFAVALPEQPDDRRPCHGDRRFADHRHERAGRRPLVHPAGGDRCRRTAPRRFLSGASPMGHRAYLARSVARRLEVKKTGP